MTPETEPARPDLSAEDIPFDRWTTGSPARYGGDPVSAPTPARQRWYDDVAICLRPAPTWLIEDVLPDLALIVLWALPEVGKTFLALLFALCVATGRAALGREIRRRGNVVYVVGEGAAHFGRRVIAWKCAHEWPVDDPAGLQIHDGPIDLLDVAAVERFISEARIFSPALIVIDTLARCTAGADENSAQEMGLAIRNLDRVKAELGCSILVLHHANASGARERGSTVPRAAADFMLTIDKVDDLLTLKIDKSKDFGATDAIALELSEIPEAHSMVMRLAGSGGGAITPAELSALRALRDSLPDGGRHTEIQVAANMRERTAYRALARLVDLRMLRKSGNIYVLTEYGRLVATRGTI